MRSDAFNTLFFQPKPIIAMIHVQALPGTPANCMSMEQIITTAVKEAKTYLECGVQAIMLENMHDRPYLNRRVGPEITSAMTAVSRAVRETVDLPLGLQILAGANREALAAAHAAGLNFIRAEGFVFGHLADEGYMDSDAADLLRYRKSLGAEKVLVFTDVKKKHSSHALTADISLSETADAAEFFMSDALIVTGTSTGKALDAGDLRSVYGSSSLPVITGSGVNPENLQKYFSNADAFIVGSSLKTEGLWSNPIDSHRVRAMLQTRSTLLENG